jgi:hypothetical protein
MPEKIKVDFHTHTSWSDGHSSLPELVRLAKDAELQVLAVADHDDYRALSQTNVENNSTNLPGIASVSPGIFTYDSMQIVRGIELSCNDHGRTVHILGLYIDEPGLDLKIALDQLREKRRDRFRSMIVSLDSHPALRSMDITLDPEEILLDVVSAGVPSRLHAAFALSQELKNRGQEISPQEAMNAYLSMGSSAYVSLDDPVFPSPQEGIETILRLHGLPVLPHLIEIESAGFNLLEKLQEYIGYGLVGFEIKSGKRSANEGDLDYRWLVEQDVLSARISIPDYIADMRGLKGQPLIVTAGSDFHGQYIPERKLGMELDVEHIERISAAYNSITR